MKPPFILEETSSSETSIWDEFPWFAIAHRHPALGMTVMMTKSWKSFSDEFIRLTESGIPFKMWCGTFRDIEEFRKRNRDSLSHGTSP